MGDRRFEWVGGWMDGWVGGWVTLPRSAFIFLMVANLAESMPVGRKVGGWVGGEREMGGRFGGWVDGRETYRQARRCVRWCHLG